MRDYFMQTHAAAHAGLQLVGLGAALAIPDMCAAMESADGRTEGARYKQWFDHHVAPRYAGFLTGEDCYMLRCSMLHQGTTQHPKGNFARFLFTEAGGGVVMHNNVMNDALNLDVVRFVDDIVGAAVAWIATAEQTQVYKDNFPRFIQRYPQGLPPFIVGAPVIS
jgi:hypothetical protein